MEEMAGSRRPWITITIRRNDARWLMMLLRGLKRQGKINENGLPRMERIHDTLKGTLNASLR
jgi:hypothetical protein